MEKIIVEFSISQKAFHKTTAEGMCESYLRYIKLGYPSDYQPIAIFNTHDDADEFIQQVGDIFRADSMGIDQNGHLSAG